MVAMAPDVSALLQLPGNQASTEVLEIPSVSYGLSAFADSDRDPLEA